MTPVESPHPLPVCCYPPSSGLDRFVCDVHVQQKQSSYQVQYGLKK